MLQFVPGPPSEIDSLNEAWAQIRNGAEVALRFEDFEPGIPQLKVILTNIKEEDEG